MNKQALAILELREANGAERNQVAMADGMDDIIGALGTGNETTGDAIDKGEV